MLDNQMMLEQEENACRQALTLVFIENQTFGEMYEPEVGFFRGTAFPELDKPWKPEGYR